MEDQSQLPELASPEHSGSPTQDNGAVRQRQQGCRWRMSAHACCFRQFGEKGTEEWCTTIRRVSSGPRT